MPSLISCLRVVLFAAVAVPLNFSFSEPGDLSIEVIVDTNDTVEITDITQGALFGGSHPISIDDRGFVSFAVESSINNTAGTGIFQYHNSLNAIAKSATPLPGVTNNGNPVTIRTVPVHAYTSSPNGMFHGITIENTSRHNYLYGASSGEILTPPITHQFQQNNSIQPGGSFDVDDGRGTTETVLFGDTVGSMAMSDLGVLAWKHDNDLYKATIASDGSSTVKAIAFLNSPATGFELVVDTTIANPLDLRGVDQAGNAYFVSSVTGAGFFDTAIYRVDHVSSELLLLFSPSTHPLEGLSLDAVPRFESDDVFPLDDGSVILRAGTGDSSTSINGFWKIAQDGEISLIKLLDPNSPTPTDDGSIRFRSLRADQADFAVSDDGTIFFTADVVDGVSNSNQEGVWAISPTDQSIRTIARSGQVAPGTTETYGAFSHISADGDGFVAFFASLSDGSKGLFVTNRESKVIALALEGQSVTEGTVGPDGNVQGEVAAGGNIAILYFTPDHAGAELDINHGAAGINEQGDVVFLADLIDGRTVIVRAAYEREAVPVGDDYIWDGGAGTGDWHTVTDGRSNWVDAFGTPWPEPPGGGSGNEEVLIGPEVPVQLNEDVSIYDLDLNGSTLVVKADLSFRNLLKVRPLGQLRLNSGSIQSSEGAIEAEGKIVKRSPESFELKVVEMAILDSELSMEDGTLLVENGESRFTTSLLSQTGGVMTLNDNSTRFQGELASVAVSGGPLNLISKSISIETDVDVNVSETAVMKMGGQLTDAEIKLVGGTDVSKRTLEFKGNGDVEILVAFNISKNDEVLIDNSEIQANEGVKFNLPAGKKITAAGKLINKGLMTLQRGGLVGEVESTGMLIVQAANAGDEITFGGTSLGIIELRSNAKYVSRLINGSGSTFRMYGGTLAPEDALADRLIFEENSRIIVKEGSNKIEFVNNESSSLSGLVEIEGAASLELFNARVDDATIKVLAEEGNLILEDTDFEKLLIEGLGTATITKRLRGGQKSSTSEFELHTKKFKFVDAELSTSMLQSTNFSIGSNPKPTENVSEISGTFEGVVTRNTAAIIVKTSATVTVEKSLVVGFVVLVEGKMILKNSVFIGDPLFGALLLGSEEFPGEIIVPEELNEPVIIHTQIVIQEKNASKFQVQKNSQVIFRDQFRLVLLYGEAISRSVIPAGDWVIDDGASFLLMKEDESPESLEPILTIEGTLSIGTAPEGVPSLNGFPDRDSDLRISRKGRLSLHDTELKLNTKRIVNLGHLDVFNSRIYGSLDNIVEKTATGLEILGTWWPSGESLITGTVNNDAIISTGSSPGAGNIDGDLNLSETSRILVEIAGTDAEIQYDQIDVTGTATLDGKLILYFLDGYEPSGGEQFEFLKAPTITGNFAEIDQSRLGRNVRFDFAVGSTGMMATAMPLTIASYADWRAAFFTEPDAADVEISDPNKDPDLDGSTNRMEYAFGGNPNVPEGSPVTFELTETGNADEYAVTATFDWANDVTDSIWFFETSSDLTNWIEVGASETGSVDNDDFSRITATLSEPIDTTQRTFLRIGVKEAL